MVMTSSSKAGGVGLIPGGGTQIPYALRSNNRKRKQYCNMFNTDFKHSPHQKNFKKRMYMDVNSQLIGKEPDAG